MNIYVGNLSHSVTEDALKTLFEQFGQVVSVKIITDKFTGNPRGFAFVQMQTKQEGQNAIDELNGHEFEGRNLTVNEARPRRPQQNRGGDRNGGGGGRFFNR